MSPTARVQRGSSDFPHFALRGATRLSFTARIEGAHSDRAASASKKDGLAVPLPPFQACSFFSTERWPGSVPTCARRTRPFLGRAFREHRDRPGCLSLPFQARSSPL